jgi:SAM-dependent methyltransferase
VSLTTAYDRSASGWDRAGTVYEPLGRLLVASSPVDLAGRWLLDAGSGSGSVARAALARGARVVAVDRSGAMLRGGSGADWPATVGDVLALPFRHHAFEIVTAGFVLNQVPPADGLAEVARVTRPGGTVLVSTWSRRPSDPVKAALNDLLSAHGWTRPAWFASLQSTVEPVSGEPERLGEAAVTAGLTEVRATVLGADLGHLDPAAVVAYRLALPHIAGWYVALPSGAKQAIVAEGVRAVRPLLNSWRPAVILLSGRTRDHSRRRPAARAKAGA